MSISGDMIITKNKIHFTKKGDVDYSIISYDDIEAIIKISKNVDSGFFMRLGPMKKSKYSDDMEMEVAFYSDLKQALKPRTDNIGLSSSWGIYSKPIKDN